jgi:hypothetical protein
LKHDFGRYGLALEADAAQIASDQRSGGISMFDLTCDAFPCFVKCRRSVKAARKS